MGGNQYTAIEKFSNKTFDAQKAKKSVVKKGYVWFDKNYHKLSTSQKIHIFLEFVKLDNANPLVDQSTHYHFTNIDLQKKSEEELVLNLLGRANGFERKPDPKNADQTKL